MNDCNFDHSTFILCKIGDIGVTGQGETVYFSGTDFFFCDIGGIKDGYYFNSKLERCGIEEIDGGKFDKSSFLRCDFAKPLSGGDFSTAIFKKINGRDYESPKILIDRLESKGGLFVELGKESKPKAVNIMW